MRTNNYKAFRLGVCFTLLSATACVPVKKYTELDQRNKSCNNELDDTKLKQEQLIVENTEMKQQLAQSSARLNSMIIDSMSRAVVVTKQQTEISKLNSRYTDLQETQEATLKGSAKETTRLMTQLQNTQEDLKKKETTLSQNEKLLNEKKKNLETLTVELDKRDNRLKELEDVLFKKDSVVKVLKTKVSNALLSFENEGLNVKIQNGKVYISMDETLLFKSGSITVDPKGAEALKKLAKVLEQNPEINISIDGHTDNIPYKSGGNLKDNWDLSVLRATSIIRILLENPKIEGKRLTAAGHGEYLPISNNKTSESRAKNRRTEIILSPKLDELFKILDNN